jgi:hypothetical protein
MILFWRWRQCGAAREERGLQTPQARLDILRRSGESGRSQCLQL